MSARAPTDGWPYITLEVNGIPLPFKHLAMPGARRNLKNALVLAQAEGLELVQAATAEGATDHDRAQVERATLLIEGSVGAYLMPLWAGPRMPTQDKVEADEAAEPADLHFKGADHKEAAGLAFAGIGWVGYNSWVMVAIGAALMFSAVYDRCPIWRAVTNQFKKMSGRA